jgi:hypothetical protein
MKLRTFLSRAAFTSITVLTPVALATLTVSATGCLGSKGPSAVGQGQKYQSGDPTFDQFFTQLYDFQIEMGKAPETEKQVRKDLAAALKVDDEGASAAMLSKKVESWATQLASQGTGLKLEIKGLDEGEDPVATLSRKGKELEGDDKTAADEVEKAALGAVKIVARMRKIRRMLDQLQSTSLALDNSVDQTFRLGGPSKKAEVRKNLADARTLIPLMQARSDEVLESAKSLGKKLLEAADTDDGKFDQPPPPPPVEPTPPVEEPAGKKPGEKKPPKPPAEKPPAEKPPAEKPPADKPPADFEP